ncbi:MAG TPA: spherulation-specific family 4 protein [Solirubrobacteraceae bacterium]|jgi:hypothetical protein|nr:spherulation-specific family 4 protein [Solirubrobacteraceae bacterium]
MKLSSRPRLAAVLASAAVAGLVVVVTVVANRSPERKATCRSALIPAYLPPKAIVELARGPARPRLLVINPASGPGAERSDDYRDAVRAAQRSGARVLGYVPTTYAMRPVGDVQTDIDRYLSWYGVDGVFLDETSHDAAHLPYYAQLSREIRASGKRVVMNPGVPPARGYFDLADVVVTFEGTYADYNAAVERMPDWIRRQPPGRIAHLVYGASREQALDAIHNPGEAGYVYATSGSMPDPWRDLPAYLDEEEEALQACS